MGYTLTGTTVVPGSGSSTANITTKQQLTLRLGYIREAINSQIQNDAGSLSAAGRSLVRLPIATLTLMEDRIMTQIKFLNAREEGKAFPYDQRIRFAYASPAY